MKLEDMRVGARVKINAPLEAVLSGIVHKLDPGAHGRVMRAIDGDDPRWAVEIAELGNRRLIFDDLDVERDFELLKPGPVPRGTKLRAHACKVKGCNRTTLDESRLCWQHRDMRREQRARPR